MSSYLQVCCGPYDLLFDIARVVEVGEAPAAAAVSADYCVWRDRQLPVLDFSALLAGQRGARPQCLVLENAPAGASQPLLVMVDHIASIRECDSRQHIDMPWVNARLARVFAGGWLDGQTRRCLLQVRLPVDVESWLKEAGDDA